VIDMKVEKALGHVSRITLYMTMKNPLGGKCQSIMRSRWHHSGKNETLGQGAHLNLIRPQQFFSTWKYGRGHNAFQGKVKFQEDLCLTQQGEWMLWQASPPIHS
jgi:hypothetical protein